LSLDGIALVPSDTSQIRTLLLVIVFQLGLCILLLGEVANAARGYDTLLALLAQLVGSVMAGAALLRLLGEWWIGNTR
jgi:hypothetical protein